MSRLVNGELYKILLRPITYLFMTVLFVAIVFSFLYFKTPSKQQALNFYDNDALASTQSVVDEFNTTSQFYGKFNTDKIITEAEQKITFYQIAKTSQTSTIKTTTDLKTLLTHLQNTYAQLKTKISAGESSFNETVATECAQAVAQLVDYFKSFQSTYNTILNYSTPVALINTNTDKKLSNLLTTTLDKLQPTNEDGAVVEFDSSTSFATYLTLVNYFENNFVFKTLDSLVADIEDVVSKITDKQLESMQNVFNNATTYLNSLNLQIQEYATDADTKTKQVKEDASKYYLVGLQIQSYVQNKILSLIFEGKNDFELNKLANDFSDLILLDNETKDKNTTSNNIYAYKIKEQLVLNEYLLSQSSKLSFAELSSGDSTTAFDFAFYGLEVCSVVIIVFSIIFGAGMIAGEQSGGTLRGLASKPFGRNKIASSKILSTFLFGTFWLFVCAVLLFVGGVILFGLDLTPILFVLNASWVVEMSPILYFLVYFLLLLVKLFLFTLIAVAVSSTIRHHSSAVLVSLGIYVCAIALNLAFGNSLWLGLLPIGNFDLFKYFGGSFIDGTSVVTSSLSPSILHGTDLIFSAIYTFVVIVVLELIIHITFKKRDIK